MHDHAAHPPSSSASAGRSVDVAVVGGGAAGLAAALQLARSRRSVLVVDGGRPRNAPSPQMHAYLGHDGRPPAEFLAIGREEVRRYGGGILDTMVVALREHGGGLRLGLADRTVVDARRVVVATGLVDELPDIPGVAEQWGRGVLHCPYCHGWEVRDQELVVIAAGPMGAHQALLFRQLSDRVTLAVHDGPGPDDEDRRRLQALDIEIVDDGRVTAVVSGPDDDVTGVELADGRVLPADAVVVGPRFRARADLLEPLGIQCVDAPMGVGTMVATDERGETSVPGLYAAGNVVDVSGQVLQAAAQGSRVGAAVNADLVHDDADRAVGRSANQHLGDSAGDWDQRYGQEEQLFSGAVNASLVAEASHLSPGRALDVGCGEGADALWLASRGWDVTAVDISDVALDRARAVASAAGLDVSWQRADVGAEAPGAAAFDLVSVHYPALRHSDDAAAIHALVDAVAPGGTLLVVGHDAASMKDRHVGFDPDDYVQPPDLVPFLGDGWTIEVDQIRPRVNPPGHDGPDIPDAVLRARRTG